MTEKDKNYSLDDILFKKRNKAYGAYKIRRKYNRNMFTAVLLAILFAGISSSFLLLIKNEPGKQKVKVTKVKLEKKKPTPPPPPPPLPLPPPKEVMKEIIEQIEQQVAVQKVIENVEVIKPTSGEGKGEGMGSGNGNGSAGGECKFPDDLDGDGLTCNDACPKNAGLPSNNGCPPMNADDYDADKIYMPGELKTMVNVREAQCDQNASNPKQYLCFKNNFKDLLLDIYSSDISFKDDVLAELESMGITDESQNTSATRAKRTVDITVVVEKDGSVSVVNVTGQSQKLKTIAKEIFLSLNKKSKKYLLPGQYQKAGLPLHPARMKYSHSIEFSYEE